MRKGDIMGTCNGNCNGCKGGCMYHCPICGAGAMMVPKETVKEMLIDNTKLDTSSDTYICLNKKCNVTYFNTKGLVEKKDVKVPIWFKEYISQSTIICYCHNVTLQDIEKVVKEQHIYKKDEILKFLNKDITKKDCLHKNPIGKECDELFKNAIEYAKGGH